MRECLAVSDAQAGTLTVYSLPSLSPQVSVSLPFSPGRLAKVPGEDVLWCAESSGSRVWRLLIPSFQTDGCFSAGPETEDLCADAQGRLLLLSGGADSIQCLDSDGTLLLASRAGVHPRSLSMKGSQVAAAGGAECALLIFDASTLSLLRRIPVPGIACGVCSLGGVWFSLCARGDYEPDALVSPADSSGRSWALPGLPGAIAACGGGILVSHLGWLTLLESSCGRIRWQSKTGGLASLLLDAGRFALFADPLQSAVGLIDLRRGRLLARAFSPEPSGAALL